ncbi:glycosyltransferase family 2 protein [uncultured Thiobacillus sp.]|uniref:glycosyltransferase family 2 protein n=1 Tax=uncultured Thiobacillus sp. TaxID=189996 RepID=UPI00262B0F46|nr:glycosyltransferase family 2 protein [uncultured Thiobacillus sp.]
MDERCEPLLSIICATYNRAAVLGRAIDSVVAQDFGGWELLVIDDGSTDHTAALKSRYECDSRIRFFEMGVNRGVGAARNYGLSFARAPWIVLLDSDNALAPDALTLMVRAASKMGTVLLHKFCVRSFDGVLMGQAPKVTTVIGGDDYLCGRFNGEHHSLVGAKLLKKHPFFESFSGGEGIIWSRIALECGAVAYHPDVTEYYETTGQDRLSVRKKNYRRLELVFREDVSTLWTAYIKKCPGHLLVRIFKWNAYWILSRIRWER